MPSDARYTRGLGGGDCRDSKHLSAHAEGLPQLDQPLADNRLKNGRFGRHVFLIIDFLSKKSTMGNKPWNSCAGTC